MYREGRVSDWGGGDNTGRTSSSNNEQRRETLHLGGSADRFATQLGGRSGTHLLSRFPPLVTTYCCCCCCCFFPTAIRFGLVFFFLSLFLRRLWTMESVLLVLSYPV
ncbi:hypothetical protein ASPTUDRAFT_845922 [Aspergillus tubingensis CBS 134.48]|uniref:Uncharacterized protein n=1 Tax=Aspergillus tubingensis (strain CBS 134.48) TaxID=767770 RepID=A0A1L9MT36_ASPTC|nr:hypothetical protein ASPTUDRAFT_845922 [Aspergillus tubingensis CBS 134.48]